MKAEDIVLKSLFQDCEEIDIEQYRSDNLKKMFDESPYPVEPPHKSCYARIRRVSLVSFVFERKDGRYELHYDYDEVLGEAPHVLY